MRLSFSQVRTFLRCPRQWALRYVEGLKIPPPGAALVGQLTEGALEAGLRPVLEGKRREPTDYVLDVFHDGFKEAKDLADWRDDDPKKMADGATVAIKGYWKTVAPKLRPVALQEKRQITKDGFSLIGIADLKEPKLIVDWKTTKRRLAWDRTLEHQLGTYSMLWETPTVGVHNLILGKEEPITLAHEVDPTELDKLWNLYRQVHSAIQMALQTGIYLPASLDHPWACKYCGFRDVCAKSDWRHEAWLGKKPKEPRGEEDMVEW